MGLCGVNKIVSLIRGLKIAFYILHIQIYLSSSVYVSVKGVLINKNVKSNINLFFSN